MPCRIFFVLVALNLSACAVNAPTAYSACAAQPGSYACQVEQYERVSN
jgi:hypothetical protein